MDLEGHEMDRGMTPREKAVSILCKFYELPHVMNMYDDGKDCAMVCVDEIISQWEYIDAYLANGNGELNPNLRYWKEVKKELECI